jgi:hypothetical protein
VGTTRLVGSARATTVAVEWTIQSAQSAVNPRNGNYLLTAISISRRDASPSVSRRLAISPADLEGMIPG